LKHVILYFVPFGFTCIQPTYEELKPGWEAAKNPKMSSIQPTYEELKQKDRDKKRITCTCIQPTYEELKQIVALAVQGSSTAYPAYL